MFGELPQVFCEGGQIRIAQQNAVHAIRESERKPLAVSRHGVELAN